MRRIVGGEVQLWHEPEVFAGIDSPRHATAPIALLPYHPGGLHNADIVLASVRAFREEQLQKKILSFIGRRCRYRDLGRDWRTQRTYIQSLMASYYAREDEIRPSSPQSADQPAWFTLLPQRVTSKFRQSKGRTLSQFVGTPILYGRGDRLRREKLTIGGIRLCNEGLRMATRPGVEAGSTQLAWQRINRVMRGPGQRTISVFEDWSFLFLPGEDESDAAEARVPAMQPSYDGTLIGIYDNDRGILRATLVNFCRMILPHGYDVGGGRMESLTFNINDFGQIIDFRHMIYPFDYYLISDVNNYTLMRRTITPGDWRHF